jgi:hypothetical protein
VGSRFPRARTFSPRFWAGAATLVCIMLTLLAVGCDSSRSPAERLTRFTSPVLPPFTARPAAKCLRTSDAVASVRVVTHFAGPTPRRGNAVWRRKLRTAGPRVDLGLFGFLREDAVLKIKLRTGNRVDLGFFRRTQDARLVAQTAQSLAHALPPKRAVVWQVSRRRNVVLAWRKLPTSREGAAVQNCLLGRAS